MVKKNIQRPQANNQEQQGADIIFNLLDKLAKEVKNGPGKGIQDNLY